MVLTAELDEGGERHAGCTLLDFGDIFLLS